MVLDLTQPDNVWSYYISVNMNIIPIIVLEYSAKTNRLKYVKMLKISTANFSSILFF